MKRTKNILTILLLFQLSTVFGQEYDKEKIKLNEIKSIKQYSYKIENRVEKSNGLIEYHLFDSKGNLTEKYEKSGVTPTVKYAYNVNGNIIKKVYYKPDGTENEISTWQYNHKGLLAVHDTYFSWNDRHYTDYYIYNNQDENIEIYNLNESGEKNTIRTMKYYDSGELLEKRFENKEIHLTKVENYDKCGGLIYKSEDGQELKFDIEYSDSCTVKRSLNNIKSDTVLISKNDMNLIQIIETSGNKRVITTKDYKGNIISNENYEYAQDSTITHSKVLQFNKKGQLIESKTFYSGKNQMFCGNSISLPPDSYFHFQYEYYDNGLKMIVNFYDQKGKRTGYTKYKVEFY